MDPKTQSHHRTRLEEIAAELRARLSSNPDTREPVSPDSAIGRLTRLDAMQAQQMALEMHRRSQQRLQRVERALALVDDGTYGTCTRCGEEIERARLEAAPDTFMCKACFMSLQRR